MKKIKKKRFSPVIRNNRPRNVPLQKETLSFILSLIYPIAKILAAGIEGQATMLQYEQKR